MTYLLVSLAMFPVWLVLLLVLLRLMPESWVSPVIEEVKCEGCGGWAKIHNPPSPYLCASCAKDPVVTRNLMERARAIQAHMERN